MSKYAMGSFLFRPSGFMSEGKSCSKDFFFITVSIKFHLKGCKICSKRLLMLTFVNLQSLREKKRPSFVLGWKFKKLVLTLGCVPALKFSITLISYKILFFISAQCFTFNKCTENGCQIISRVNCSVTLYSCIVVQINVSMSVVPII